jgi:uncharacterized protein (TIGR02284 family)
MATDPIQASKIADTEPNTAPTDIQDQLEALITVNTDAADGFTAAAAAVDDAAVKGMFSRFADERRTFAQELTDVAATFGGASKNGSVLAAMHRAWISVKDSFTTDDHAILEAVATGEEHAADVYSDAMATDLPPQVATVVSRQFERIQTIRRTIEGMISVDA